MKHLLFSIVVLVIAACSNDKGPAPEVDHNIDDGKNEGPPFSLVLGTGDRSGALSVEDLGSGIDPDTHWQWASVTKLFVAVLAMQDVEAGLLTLADTISNHLPGFGSGARAKITIEQLLRSTSGLGEPSGLPDSDKIDPLVYCDVPMVGEPGAHFRYTNCDFIVMAAILEAVNGETWQELLRSRILEPTNMNCGVNRHRFNV